MAVVVVGDIDTEQAKQLVVKHFGGLKNPAKPRPRVATSIPLKNLDEAVIATDKEANVATISITQGRYLNKDNGTYANYRQQQIVGFFNTMLSNRLQELTQLATPPFLGARSGVFHLVGDYHELNSTVAIGKSGIQAAVDALLEENTRAAKSGFSAAELERAKLNVLRTVENQYNERDKTLSGTLAAEFIRNFLNNETIPGIDAEYQFHKEIIASISLNDVNQYAKTILNNKTPKLIIYQGNDKPDYKLPTPAQLTAMVQSASQKQIADYTEKVLEKSLFEKAPAAAAILSETKDAQLGTKEITFANGIKVVLKKPI